MRCRRVRYHYIQAPTPELYDVVADPREMNDLAAQQSATIAVLDDKLRALLRQNPFKPAESRVSELNADALDKLRALGYLTYRTTVFPGAVAGGLARSQEQAVGV